MISIAFPTNPKGESRTTEFAFEFEAEGRVRYVIKLTK